MPIITLGLRVCLHQTGFYPYFSAVCGGWLSHRRPPSHPKGRLYIPVIYAYLKIYKFVFRSENNPMFLLKSNYKNACNRNLDLRQYFKT